MAKTKNLKKAYKHRNRIKSATPLAPVKNEAKKVVEKVAAPAKKVEKDLENGLTQLFSAAQVETLAQAGVKKVEDLAQITEKELLALKGIGPAAVKKVKEAGHALKA